MPPTVGASVGRVFVIFEDIVVRLQLSGSSRYRVDLNGDVAAWMTIEIAIDHHTAAWRPHRAVGAWATAALPQRIDIIRAAESIPRR